MDCGRKRKNPGNYSRLITVLLVSGLIISGCANKAERVKPESAIRPIILVFPFYLKGRYLPGIMDATEKMIYFLQKGGRFIPLDAGDSVNMIKESGIRGIYPSRKELKQLGKKTSVDFFLIGKITGKNSNPAGISLSGNEIIEITVRLIDAKTGKLRQIIIKQEEADDSASSSIERMLAEIAGALE
jgi:hypothetical protein